MKLGLQWLWCHCASMFKPQGQGVRVVHTKHITLPAKILLQDYPTASSIEFGSGCSIRRSINLCKSSSLSLSIHLTHPTHFLCARVLEKSHRFGYIWGYIGAKYSQDFWLKIKMSRPFPTTACSKQYSQKYSNYFSSRSLQNHNTRP